MEKKGKKRKITQFKGKVATWMMGDTFQANDFSR